MKAMIDAFCRRFTRALCARDHARQQNPDHVPQTRKGGKVYDSAPLYHVLQRGFVMAAIGAGLTAQKADAQTQVNFEPDYTANIGAPVVGIAGNEDNYFLTFDETTGSVDKNLSNYETILSNPTSAKDSASFITGYMLQLGTDNFVYQINLATGNSSSFEINDEFVGGIDVGNNAFAIGYEPSTNMMGVANYANGEMTFREYDFNTHQFSAPVTFSFDVNQWGTPTTGDYYTKGNNQRMVIGLRDGPEIDFSGPLSYFLDMNLLTGDIDQFGTIVGSSKKLEGLFYDSDMQKLVVEYDFGTGGRVEVAPYQAIPEAKDMALLSSIIVLLFVIRKKLQNKKLKVY